LLDQTDKDKVWGILRHLSPESYIELENYVNFKFPRNEDCVCWLLKHKQFNLAINVMNNSHEEITFFTKKIFLAALKGGAPLEFIQWMLKNDTYTQYSTSSTIDHEMVIKLAKKYCYQNVCNNLLAIGYKIQEKI
jgi:hypothetical protein